MPSANPVDVPFRCMDKDGIAAQPPQDHPCSMRRGSRCAFISPPGHGKSSMIKWCCVKSAPWEAVVLIHGAHSREYDDIDPLIKTTFAEATTDWWAQLSKTHNGGPICCIVDDTNMADLDRKERSNLFALFQHVATHCCVTVLCAAHSWTQLIPRVRRCCDVVSIWPPVRGGGDQLPYLARSLGCSKNTLQAAFDACGDSKFNFVTIYTDPPEGRAAFMLNMTDPWEPPE